MPRKRSLNPKVLLVIVGDEVQGISSDPSQEVSSAQGWLWEGTWGWQKVTNQGFFFLNDLESLFFFEMCSAA